MVLLISSEVEYINALNSGATNMKLLVIDFFTSWCAPCLLFAPEFEKLSIAFSADADFVKIDCDKLQNLAIKLNIKCLPTVKGFVNKQEAFSLSGSGVLQVPKEIRDNTILPILKHLCSTVSDLTPQMYLLKVIDNIINNPSDGKYRLLKLSNLAVQQNLLAFEGVKECLLSLGFREMDEQLIMDEPSSFETFTQFRRQLAMLMGKSESKAQSPQSSNNNIQKFDGNSIHFKTEESIKSESVNHIFNGQAEKFIDDINLDRRRINIYENIDLMNIVSALVDIDHYKSPSITQEMVLKRLLRWFKYEFFSWFNVPNCSMCNKPYSFNDRVFPTPEESKWLANTVELYKCDSCSALFRFPRYNHPEKLLTTRTGRCGEWANCFCLVLRTFINEGIFEQARFVHDWSDHVWCELYMKLDNESDQKWIHVDPCEGTYNAPLTYQVGWKKKIDYVIGISLISGDVQDVTWRYTNNFQETLSNRRLIDEKVLVNKLVEFHKVAGTSSKMICKELVSFLPSKNAQTKLSVDEMMGRTTGSEAWRLERGELGNQPIWKKTFFGQSIKPTAYELVNNCLHIQYNCSIDSYQRPCDIESNKYISGEGEAKSSSSKSVQRKSSSANKAGKDLLSHDTDGWQSLAASWVNIKRKVEYDWQVVYLARMSESPADAVGDISWVIDLTGSNKKITQISVFASSAEFHSASVKWKLHSGNSIEVPINGFVTTTGFNDCSIVTLSALLQSDPSSVDSTGWQHAQLCRQKSTDFDVKTLQIKVELCDA